MVLSLSNKQRGAKIDLSLLQRLAECALPLCLNHPGHEEPVLPHLEEVEIALVSDRVISDVHRRFMSIPGVTDVITFPHGEIIISVATASRQAAEFGQKLHEESTRYIVHGLLHLNGHEDVTQKGAAGMWRAQEAVVSTLWQAVSAPAS